MGMSFIAEPQDFTPAYNEVKFIVDSTNKNLDGFRYIFEVYESGTSNRIGYYKALPTYGTGYGMQDISKLLCNLVSYDFDPSVTTFYDAANSYYKPVLTAQNNQMDEAYNRTLFSKPMVTAPPTQQQIDNDRLYSSLSCLSCFLGV